MWSGVQLKDQNQDTKWRELLTTESRRECIKGRGGGQFQSKKKIWSSSFTISGYKMFFVVLLVFFSFKGSKKFQSVVKIREVHRQTIWNSRIVYTCTSEFKTKHKPVIKKTLIMYMYISQLRGHTWNYMISYSTATMKSDFKNLFYIQVVVFSSDICSITKK